MSHAEPCGSLYGVWLLLGVIGRDTGGLLVD